MPCVDSTTNMVSLKIGWRFVEGKSGRRAEKRIYADNIDDTLSDEEVFQSVYRPRIGMPWVWEWPVPSDEQDIETAEYISALKCVEVSTEPRGPGGAVLIAKYESQYPAPNPGIGIWQVTRQLGAEMINLNDIQNETYKYPDTSPVYIPLYYRQPTNVIKVRTTLPLVSGYVDWNNNDIEMVDLKTLNDATGFINAESWDMFDPGQVIFEGAEVEETYAWQGYENEAYKLGNITLNFKTNNFGWNFLPHYYASSTVWEEVTPHPYSSTHFFSTLGIPSSVLYIAP